MIYELRMYTTRAGKTKEVVNASATVAQSIRDGDDYGKLIGHWWSSIGRLNQYVHMWEYKDVEEMRKLRSELSQLEDWRKKFIPLVAPHILTQKIRILRPAVTFRKPQRKKNIYELRIASLNIGQSIKWMKSFIDIREKLKSTSVNIGVWNVELSDPNEIIHLWSHDNTETMQEFWVQSENNPLFEDLNLIQEQAIRSEESIILSPSSCSPLQ